MPRLNEMNWTCLVYGGPMAFIIVWWFVDARKWFNGPKVNVEHRMLNRDESSTGSKHGISDEITASEL